jgi:hypothetical protein
MKSPLFSATLLVLALALTSAQAATDPTAVWRAADDARVAAMISADPAKLAEVFSDDLLYVHSNGKPDTKTSFVAAISAGRSVYHSVTYEQREFREVSPGLVLMTARCRVVPTFTSHETTGSSKYASTPAMANGTRIGWRKAIT